VREEVKREKIKRFPIGNKRTHSFVVLGKGGGKRQLLGGKVFGKPKGGASPQGEKKKRKFRF